MAIPYHTHDFAIPVASDAEVAAGVISDKVVVPSSLGSAAVADVDRLIDPKSQTNTVTYHGAAGDGVTDDAAAITAALAAVDSVVLPYTPSGYLLSSKLTIPGGKEILFEEGAKLVPSGNPGNLIEFSGDNSSLVNPIIDVSAMTGTDEIIWVENRNRVFIRNPKIVGGPVGRGAITLKNSSYCQITGEAEVLDVMTNAIVITGALSHDNIVYGMRFKGTTPGMCILLESGAHRNQVAMCRTDAGGAELVGIRYDSYSNIISDCRAYECEDAGFSITGSGNIIIGCHAINCEQNGFAIYGARNLVSGCYATNNGQGGAGSGYAGFSIRSAYGGIASNNIVSGCYSDDDQAVKTQDYLAKVSADAYAEWATSQSITSGDYRSYLNNLYIATTAGTTGATPPTHTTGTASDGAVTWQYIATQSGGMMPTGNILDVRGNRYGVAPFVNDSSGSNRLNVGFDRVAATSMVIAPSAWATGVAVTVGEKRYTEAASERRYYEAISNGTTGATPPTHTSGSASDGTVSWYYIGSGGEFSQISVGTKYPRVQSALQLRFAGADREIHHLNQSPEGYLSASPGTLAIRNTGTTLLMLYGKNSGTDSNTGWLPFMPVIGGATASRPAASGTGYRGFQYFDTTLGKPIWWSGTAWVDATGAAV